MRLGIVGTESSHVDLIIDHLNVAEARPDTRVVALAGGDRDRSRELARRGRIEQIVDSVEDLLDLADVLLVTDRHGGRHLEHAMPFLTEGRPVFVDKPMACSVADATRIISAAREHGTLVTSYSALRHLPDTDALIRRLPSLGPLRSVVTTGPADPASEHGGIFYYGIHPVDVAMLMTEGPVGEIRVSVETGIVVATAMIGETHVTVNLVAPGDDGRSVPFHAMLVGQGDVATSELRIGGNYVSHGLEVFLDMVEHKAPAIPEAELLRPIRFLETVRDLLAQV